MLGVQSRDKMVFVVSDVKQHTQTTKFMIRTISEGVTQMRPERAHRATFLLFINEPRVMVASPKHSQPNAILSDF